MVRALPRSEHPATSARLATALVVSSLSLACAQGAPGDAAVDPSADLEPPAATSITAGASGGCPEGTPCTHACKLDGDCGKGQSCCGGACTDTKTDPRHCGICAVGCSTPSHASAACKGGVCGLGACDPGWSDCDGNPTNGCETAPANDAHHCGACGKSCSAPANATATCSNSQCTSSCSQGFLSLAGGCANFGGSYEANDAGCSACEAGNAMTGTCGCPGGFVASAVMRTLDDCNGLHGASIAFCATSGFGSSADWAGAYQTDDAVACSAGCRVANPYTGGCACPAGATPIVLRTQVATSCDTNIGSYFVLCFDASAPHTTFGGAYQLDDAVPNGLGCRTANPATGACSCPAGMNARWHRVIADGSDGNVLGSSVYVCTP